MLGHQANNSPFLPENESEYRAWRKRKLQASPEGDQLPIWRLDNDHRFTAADLPQIRSQTESRNFILFESRDILDKSQFLSLNRQLGLLALDDTLGSDDDRVTSLRVLDDSDERARYIPYTDRAMNWHTDGYYNDVSKTIRAFALYCVNPALTGGSNFLFDHEMMYLLLRDTDLETVDALMESGCMTIPANVKGKKIIRSQSSCSVFSLHEPTGRLQMRYTSRPANIIWRNDHRIKRALDLVRQILASHEAVIEVRLAAGQGIICNNILHGRQAFKDGDESRSRLVYRARYRDYIDVEYSDSSGAAA